MEPVGYVGDERYLPLPGWSSNEAEGRPSRPLSTASGALKGDTSDGRDCTTLSRDGFAATFLR
jgi:hypothetical protein